MEMIGGESFTLGLLVCYDPFILGHCFYFHVRRDFQGQISVSSADFHGVVLYIIQYDNAEWNCRHHGLFFPVGNEHQHFVVRDRVGRCDRDGSA